MDNLFFSISKINSKKMKKSFQDFIDDVDLSDLESSRPSLDTRRMATLFLMRSLLIENYLFSDGHAKDIEIHRLTSGRPYLKCRSHKKCELPFISISHSGPWIACVLSDHQTQACIDIEDLTINRPLEKLSAYAFSAQENKFVIQTRKHGFYRLWTAKEAIAKCRGQGLAQALKIDFSSQLSPFSSNGDKEVNSEGTIYSLFQGKVSSMVFFTIAKKILSV